MHDKYDFVLSLKMLLLNKNQSVARNLISDLVQFFEQWYFYHKFRMCDFNFCFSKCSNLQFSVFFLTVNCSAQFFINLEQIGLNAIFNVIYFICLIHCVQSRQYLLQKQVVFCSERKFENYCFSPIISQRQHQKSKQAGVLLKPHNQHVFGTVCMTLKQPHEQPTEQP